MVIRLQNALAAHDRTGSDFDGSDPEYQQMLRELTERANIGAKLLDFVRRCAQLTLTPAKCRT